MTSAAVDSGFAGQVPVDPDRLDPNGHAHEMCRVEANLGVAAPPLIGHRSELHHGGAAVDSGGQTRSRVPARNQEKGKARSRLWLTMRAVDKV